MRICDRATILRNGHNVDLLETSKVNEHQLVQAMLGQLVESGNEENKRNVDRNYGDPALTIMELSSGEVVRDVSFSVKAGEILGLVALEGQGQDRLFELLSGDRQPSSGKILVHGTTRQFRSPFDAVQSGVVLVPGDRLRALLPDLSIRQNLALPLFNRIREWFGLPSDENEKVENAIDQLSIDTRAASQVRRLSGGNQQKVVIGRWLVSGFETLLCFDPTRGIDIQTKREIYVLLRKLASEGAAVLLYTSELAEIPLVCDRVLVMHAGKIVDEQDAATATESSMLTAAHGLDVTK